MLVSSSDGCCLDGLVAAILLRAAAMIAVLRMESAVVVRGLECRVVLSGPGKEFANVGTTRLAALLGLAVMDRLFRWVGVVLKHWLPFN